MSEILNLLNEIDQKARSLYPENYIGVGILNTSANDPNDDEPWIAWINSKYVHSIPVYDACAETAVHALQKLLGKLSEIPERQENSET